MCKQPHTVSNHFDALTLDTFTQLHFIIRDFGTPTLGRWTMVTTRGKQSRTATVPVTVSQDASTHASTRGEALIRGTVTLSMLHVSVQCL